MKARPILVATILILNWVYCQGQNDTGKGKVTFVTSANAYVKFETTNGVMAGDTLFRFQDGVLTACLVVKNISSMSCVAEIIKGCEIKKDDEIIQWKKSGGTQGSGNKPVKTESSSNKSVSERDKVRGLISAAGYSNFSPTRGNVHRTMYRLSFDANHINNSKFSLETYINYRQNFISKENTSTAPKNALNIYSMAICYDVNPSLSFALGRKINPKVSSLGALDGLQGEKYFGSFYTGLLAGFRPDIMDYSFNKNLFQYGAYVGLKTENKIFYSQTTLGLLQQDNKSHVDRRYTYFQHSSTIGKKVNLFSSFEIDLYNSITGSALTDARLTNFYASASYQINRMFDLNLAYDSRKQILYYETLKTEIERLLDNDQARQGVRARLNIKPFQTLIIGLSYSKRFQSNDQNNSDNINGMLTYSRLPWIGGGFSMNYNQNTSSYAVSDILSLRHYRTLLHDKMDFECYYRIANYKYWNQEWASQQKYYGASLSWRTNWKLSFSLLGELASLGTENNFRLNSRITKNF